MNKAASVVELVPMPRTTKRVGRRATDPVVSVKDLVEQNKALEARLKTALEMVQQRDQHISELNGRYQALFRNKNEHQGERLQGWFVSGPSSTSIVFSRSRITDHVLALCAVNGDRVDAYGYHKVTVLLEKNHAQQEGSKQS